MGELLIGLQDPDIERQFSMKAMTGRGDNDTSVQSQLHVMRTAVGDPHGGEIPMRLKA